MKSCRIIRYFTLRGDLPGRLKRPPFAMGAFEELCPWNCVGIESTFFLASVIFLVDFNDERISHFLLNSLLCKWANLWTVTNSLHMKQTQRTKENLQFPLKYPAGMIHIYSKRSPICKQWFSKSQETPRQLVPRETFEMAGWSARETPEKWNFCSYHKPA